VAASGAQKSIDSRLCKRLREPVNKAKGRDAVSGFFTVRTGNQHRSFSKSLIFRARVCRACFLLSLSLGGLLVQIDRQVGDLPVLLYRVVRRDRTQGVDAPRDVFPQVQSKAQESTYLADSEVDRPLLNER